jgi:hypothetical protein
VVAVHDASPNARARDRAEVAAVGAGRRIVTEDGQGVAGGGGDSLHDQSAAVAGIGYDGEVAGPERSPPDGDEAVPGLKGRVHAGPRHLEAARPQHRDGPGGDGD